MSRLLRVLLVLGGLAVAALGSGAQAATPAGAVPSPGARPQVVIDAAGKPVFVGVAGWTELSRGEKDGMQVVEYRFTQAGTEGKQGVLRVMLKQIARSVRFADLSAEEKNGVETARDAAIQHMMDEVDAMPGVDFLSGGTQFTFTAMDEGKRYYYVHYVSVKGIDQAGSALRPAIAIDFRCRNAIEVDAPGYVASTEALDDFCRDALLDINKTD
jgi:hypothetical protein